MNKNMEVDYEQYEQSNAYNRVGMVAFDSHNRHTSFNLLGTFDEKRKDNGIKGGNLCIRREWDGLTG